MWEGFPKEKRERIFQNFSRVFSDFLVYIYFSLKNLFPSHQKLKTYCLKKWEGVFIEKQMGGRGYVTVFQDIALSSKF